MGDMVSYVRRNSFVSREGTAIKWVSRYSESWTRMRGSTTDARDLVDNVPLGKCQDTIWQNMWTTLGISSYVCLRWSAASVVFPWVYCENLARTSLSMLAAS